MKLDARALREIRARAYTRFVRGPRDPKGLGKHVRNWDEGLLDPTVLDRLIAQAGARAGPERRAARIRLGHAVIAHAHAQQPISGALLVYVGQALTRGPLEAFGYRGARGRDPTAESERKAACAAIVAFLLEECHPPATAWKRAAKALGYASAKSLRRACAAPLARLQRRYQGDPYRAWHLAWAAFHGCSDMLPKRSFNMNNPDDVAKFFALASGKRT